MKIPNTPISSGNGYYNNQESEITVQYLSDNSDSDVDTPTQDGDFSEYLWMENEEEFDNQVLKQLEEEALMEQCIEAMLEDERDSDGQPATSTPSWSTNGNTSSTAASAASLADAVDSLHVSDDLAKGSTLNPNALEFVPRETPVPPIESKA